MIKIDPEAIYERAELAKMLPSWDHHTLTNWMRKSGAWRPYPGSRKLLVKGESLMPSAVQQTDALLQPADFGKADSLPHPRGQRLTFVQKRKVRDCV